MKRENLGGCYTLSVESATTHNRMEPHPYTFSRELLRAPETPVMGRSKVQKK